MTALSRRATLAIALTTLPLALGAQQPPKPQPMTLVILEPGTSWKADIAPPEQLKGHLTYIAQLLETGDLVANGTHADHPGLRGFYLYNTGSAEKVSALLAADPSIQAKILAVKETIGWNVLINALAQNQAGQPTFILRYRPGPAWKPGKPLTEQDVAAHFAYMIDAAKAGKVIAAGPGANGQEGLYIVSGDRAAIDALVAADPGTAAGLFKPELIGWTVFAMRAAPAR